MGSGQTASQNNFGDVPPSTVSGRVFVDHNNSGTLNGSDSGLGGVTVTLTAPTPTARGLAQHGDGGGRQLQLF